MGRHVRGVLASSTAAAAAVLLVIPAGPAVADFSTPGAPNPRPVTQPESWDENYNPVGSIKRKTFNEGQTSCHVVSSPSYLGAICVDVTGGGGRTLTIEEILRGDPLPECWDMPLTQRELSGLNLMNSDEWVWHWHKCLLGIDPVTFDIEPEGVRVSTMIRPYKRFPTGTNYVVVTLTDNQARLVERYLGDDFIPDPVMGASPDPIPLVNKDVSFYNYGTDEVVVGVPAVGMRMRARITGMTVLPEGRPGPVVRCEGTGYQADPGQERRDHPQGCWHTYEQSSLTRADDVYNAEIHTHWTVDVSMNGGSWQHFNEFTKGAYHMVAVNEVQAVVVP